MESEYAIIGVIALGVFSQSLLLVHLEWTKWDILYYLVCIGIGLLGMLPGKHETTYVFMEHISLMLVLFTFSFSSLFKDRLLPFINEQAMLIWNILTVYALVLQFGFHSTWLMIVLIPTLATVLLGCISSPPPFAGKVLYYVWFLMMIVILGLLQFRFGDRNVLFDPQVPLTIRLLNAFASGAAFLAIGINVCYLFFLIPIPGKHETMEERMKLWHEDIYLMGSRFIDDQSRWTSTVLVILLLGGLLAVNGESRFISGWLLINLCILFLPYVLRILQGMRRRTRPNPARTCYRSTRPR